MQHRKHKLLLIMTTAIKKTGLAAVLLCTCILFSHTAKATAKTAISLSPHLTELVYAAGAGDRLLAVDQTSNYPPAAATLPHIGSGIAPTIERIALLQPDLL